MESGSSIPPESVEELKAIAPSLSIELSFVSVRRPEQFGPAFAAVNQAKAQALYVNGTAQHDHIDLALHQVRDQGRRQADKQDAICPIGSRADQRFMLATASDARTDGNIILEGRTSNGALPARAAKLAREVEGVNDVDNRFMSVPSHGRF